MSSILKFSPTLTCTFSYTNVTVSFTGIARGISQFFDALKKLDNKIKSVMHKFNQCIQGNLTRRKLANNFSKCLNEPLFLFQYSIQQISMITSKIKVPSSWIGELFKMLHFVCLPVHLPKSFTGYKVNKKIVIEKNCQ